MLLLLLSGYFFINTCAMANSPSEPYNLILKAISNHNIDRAWHWCRVTQWDFPDSKEAELAGALLVPLEMVLLDSELEVKMAYLKGADTGLLGYAEFFATLMYTGMRTWEATGYVNAFLDNYSNDKTYDFNLIVPEPFDYDRYELEMISRGQRTLYYTDPRSIEENISKNLLSKWILAFKALESDDTLERARLFYNMSLSLHTGLSLIRPDDIEIVIDNLPIIKQARDKCIEIALHLTEENRYTDLRVDIEELKIEIDREE